MRMHRDIVEETGLLCLPCGVHMVSLLSIHYVAIV